MPLLVNIRHLATRSLNLKGELAVEELDIDSRDEMVRVTRPLKYDLVVHKLPGSVLVQGTRHITLNCQCVRCLEPFEYNLELNGPVCHLELRGEEQAALVNDCVDLTPCLREDILLEFPQHPLCKLECRQLPHRGSEGAGKAASGGQAGDVSPAWDELNKLRF
jgi:uncharacterized metal-binding protein YceD (DUF177 family)